MAYLWLSISGPFRVIHWWLMLYWVCEMLQDHLNQCILIARTNCSDGYLEAVPEESEEDTETTCNQNELNNSNCHSTVMTSDILAPSDNG
ncbi:unnamed protein product [Acanthocheilonema viteae]|uniref:Uncharacterized protein n=1 Tax=Acanthocheilonema viteae TaxID=6277 RepID=A0A498SKV0_ACAVI|nr:unnamed protein product [Acanthocheilonema viteae]